MANLKKNSQGLLLGLALLFLFGGESPAEIVRVSSNIGEFDIRLFPEKTPKTAANFLGYVRRGDYNNSIIHRSVPGFIIQGGGFRLNKNSVDELPSGPFLVNEPGLSNVRGTVSMAKLGGDPNSATNQWFVNLSNANAANLDNQNGGFTVFGEVLGNGMDVADAIAALPVYNVRQLLGGAFGEVPLWQSQLTAENLVLFQSVRALAGGARAFSFDFSKGTHGFVSGFADLPQKHDPALYALRSGHGKTPAELGSGSALFISGTNRSDDLWMYWRKKISGLAPGKVYEATFDLQLASSAAAGAVGIGGAPGESVFIKAGASAKEPLASVDKFAWLRMNVDKGNQSQAGGAASILGHAAKPSDGTSKFSVLNRDNRSSRLKVRPAADGSLWLFFGSDSGFEGTTLLYYSKFTAVFEPVGRNQTISFFPPATVKFGMGFSANATASSGLPVAFASSNASVAKFVDGRIQIVGTGTTRITASQPGDMKWNAAASVVRSITVAKGNQKIVFANPGNKTFPNDAKFTLAATVNSKLPITFTSSNPSVLSIQGREATIRGPGEVTITAAQNGNRNWNPAQLAKWTLRLR